MSPLDDLTEIISFFNLFATSLYNGNDLSCINKTHSFELLLNNIVPLLQSFLHIQYNLGKIVLDIYFICVRVVLKEERNFAYEKTEFSYCWRRKYLYSRADNESGKRKGKLPIKQTDFI